MSYFECEHCLKKFVRESYYKKHSCDQMLRHKLLRKPVGQTAYNFYCEWLGYKGYKVHSQGSFMDSRLFKPFIQFVRFSRDMALPGISKFIEHMAKLDIHPRDWSKKLVYDHYIGSFDELFSPDEQFEISVDTIHELARAFECKREHVFLYIEPSVLIGVVQAKKLSPWFLLLSDSFKTFMRHEMTREQQILLNQYIKADSWDVKFSRFPNKTAKFKKRVKELGL